MHQNEMKLEFDSCSCNESFARVTVAAFMTQLNPTLEEVSDVKTAVSEAVTNSIIHAYGKSWKRTQINNGFREEHPNSVGDTDRKLLPATETEEKKGGGSLAFIEEKCVKKEEKIEILCRIFENVLEVEVRDTGCGIADVKRAMEPMFTTRAECDRAGMGFSFMEAFMDTLEVESELGKGTTVRMSKRIARENAQYTDGIYAHMEGRERVMSVVDRNTATMIGREPVNNARFPSDGCPEKNRQKGGAWTDGAHPCVD
ncbi:MAG: ATP-binding protein [Clostridiales bacterium]|nr:ATP-binding protein [Clostridiales bacterium]